MLRTLTLAAGVAFGTLTWGTIAQAAPLEAYGKLPSIEQAVISPGGAYVAYVVTDGEQRRIAVQSTADHKFAGVSAAGNEKVRDIRWAGDEHLVITTSTAREAVNLLDQDWLVGPRVESFAAQDLNLKTGRMQGLLDDIQEGAEVRNHIKAMNTVLSVPVVRSVGGKPVAFVRSEYFDHNQGMTGLFRVDLNSGAAYLVERGGRSDYSWVVDGQGQTVAQAVYNDSGATWTLMLKGPGGWRTAQTFDAPIDTPDLGGLGPDGQSVVVDLFDQKAGRTWRELSLKSGTWGDDIAVVEGQHAIYDPISGRLIGKMVLGGDVGAYTFFDAHDAVVWRTVAKAFPGDIVTLESWSDDRTKAVVRVDSAEQGPAYALVDLTTHQADWLGSEYDLKPEDISPVKAVRYRAADGLEISGYLTLPRGRDPHGLPLVVLAHGGPASRDTPGFDWWAQALASRGYAVLQPNFRGSAGYGQDFLAAGFGQWGRKMQTDLSDGVRDLVRQGVADPKRVCIVGGSYGGYAALAGATLDRGVYRCAVSYAGPADLASQIGDSRQKGGLETLRYWERFIGAQGPQDPVLAQLSPAAHAAQADIPILLIHGRDDTVVSIGQSRRMADALRAAGKPVELVELPGEDHWLSRGATRLQMLQATVAFLERNDPPN
jgi:dipeptidyl aminopeptidase/acylaminoacyl peptidase